jgi:2,3-dihydroxy-p-cumate/2,3-dihydroxybenzoate 3,4-dioxygenase
MASGSIFQYFSDPDGITIEYTSGMEEFPELGARQPRMLDQSYRTTDVWDGERPTNLRSLGNYERAETAMA